MTLFPDYIISLLLTVSRGYTNRITHVAIPVPTTKRFYTPNPSALSYNPNKSPYYTAILTEVTKNPLYNPFTPSDFVVYFIKSNMPLYYLVSSNPISAANLVRLNSRG